MPEKEIMLRYLRWNWNMPVIWHYEIWCYVVQPVFNRGGWLQV